MTLLVAVQVPSGIAISADSRLGVILPMQEVEGALVPLRARDAHRGEKFAVHVSDSARKLFVVRDRFVVAIGGTLASGATLDAIDQFARSPDSAVQSVPEFIAGVTRAFHDLPGTGHEALFVAGVYVSGEVASYRVLVREQTQRRLDREPDGRRRFGIDLLVHKDVALRLLTGAVCPYSEFSLQDAVNFGRFLVYATTTQQGFELGRRAVGGSIDTAVITQTGARFVARQEVVTQAVGAPPAPVGEAA
jgi:hypothetical protein